MNPNWIVPDWPVPVQVRALVTTRAGGVSTAPYAGLNLGDHVGDDPACVAQNRAILRASLPAEPVWLKQVHGIKVFDADSSIASTEADACMDSSSRFGVCSADCRLSAGTILRP